MVSMTSQCSLIFPFSIAVNNMPREIDLLHITYAQQSIIKSGGYMPENVFDVQKIITCGKWDLKKIITHEFSLAHLEEALVLVANVIIKMD